MTLPFNSPKFLLPLFLGACFFSGALPSQVKLEEKPLVIPTYLVGRPDPNPRFYEGRAYQGAQGRVYPYPMLDRLTDRKVPRTYKALFLENEFVKLCVLPGIGGRLFSALDKTDGYDFIYRQHVIKPGLIGMLGAWISGGIEWNFPHHHRATSFLPMDYTLRKNADGSGTVWLGETEFRHRMRWVLGVTLFPGKSYFQVTVRLFNRTPWVHSFLYWANVAVHANDQYQVIFPPSVQYTVYHAKNDYCSWPVARQVYRGVDYTRGVDVSWWKNHPRPGSFFVLGCKEDFFAGYDHGREAGICSFADHTLAPGKKLWEWGPSPQGSLWDTKVLTDRDGPYAELMAGAFSDNQPDYSWIQPCETKQVRQYWYPLRGIGGVKKANLQAAANLEIRKGPKKRTAFLGFNTTSSCKGARVLLRAGTDTLLEKKIDIGPARPFTAEVPLPQGVKETDLSLSLQGAGGKEILSYRPRPRKKTPPPRLVHPPPPPQKIQTVEELYLAGLRLEQFYNPSLSPIPYYKEALRRDPGHAPTQTALGIRLLKEFRFHEAERHFRLALARLERDYTSPKDGEAEYYLGWTLKFLGRFDEAWERLGKAAWSFAFHSAACLRMAEILCARKHFSAALERVRRSLWTSAWNLPALNLEASLLRRLGRKEEAARAASLVLSRDPLNLRARFELHLAGRGPAPSPNPILEEYPWLSAQTFLETAAEYMNAGLWEEAKDLLLSRVQAEKPSTFPLVYYYLGYCFAKLGDSGKALEFYKRAETMPWEYCFPFRAGTIRVLREAARADPAGGRVHYYLGNLLYDSQPRAAVKEWEKARALGVRIPTLHRNLALAYFRVEHDPAKALVSMEKALSLDKSDPRLFYEMDVLSQAAGIPAEKRLALLEGNQEVVSSYNDSFAREVRLLVETGSYDKALEFLAPPHHFRKWEGLGNIHSTYVDAHLLRGIDLLEAGDPLQGIRDFQAALEYPENLETAPPYEGGRECEIYYWLGRAFEAAGKKAEAMDFFRKSASAPRSGGRPALDFFRASSLRKLGRPQEARKLFVHLLEQGREKLASLKKGTSLDFFAKFGKKESPGQKKARALYLMGLGAWGLGDLETAIQSFKKALNADPGHVWARWALKEAEKD